MTTPCIAHVQAIGVIAPGLPDWPQAAAILAAERPLPTPAPPARPQPQLLPPNERRRAPASVLIALHAAEEAMRGNGFDASATTAVFASSDAEMAIIHRICSTLAEPARAVSPTDFHNSVHNTAAGYWGIAARCTRPATTLAAYDGTVAAGLLEAFGLLADGEPAVLLVLYDVPPPPPLFALRPMQFAFGAALLLSAQSSPATRATLGIAPAARDTRMHDPALEALRLGNPSARILPLLAAIAAGRSERIALPASGVHHLGIDVRCP